MCRTCNHEAAAVRIKGLLSRLRNGVKAADRTIKPWEAPTERVAGILEWVECNAHVTPSQMTALKNIHNQHQKPPPPFKHGNHAARKSRTKGTR